MPPVFRPVTTDCKGERRFISTIARRLDALGALTRGQRQAGSQNLFDPADNLESDYAKDALSQWYRLLYQGKLASTTLDAFEKMTGLSLIDADSGGLKETLPPIQRWLNRLLALRIATQNAVFEEFFALIQARIDAARDAGTLDLGVETIRAERIETLTDLLLHRDAVSGAETRLQKLELHLRYKATSFRQLMTLWEGSEDIAFLHNTRSGRAALRVPSWSAMDDDGNPIPMCRLIRPAGQDRMKLASFARSQWRPIERERFEALWEAETDEARHRIDVETVHIATGLLLPVWDRLPFDDVRVWRVEDGEGDARLGRIISPGNLAGLMEAFEVDGDAVLSSAELVTAANAGGGVVIPALPGARLVRARVNDQWRLEIRDYPFDQLDWLKSLGAFTQIIAFRTRLYLPPDQAEAILTKIAARGKS